MNRCSAGGQTGNLCTSINLSGIFGQRGETGAPGENLTTTWENPQTHTVDMEPPSPSQSDGLLPQDLSMCSMPAPLNLTMKGENSLLRSSSMDALQVVKTPNWYGVDPGRSSKGLPFPECDPNHIPQPSSQQIQPDDAFSSTTVTLSYVSRSHVFSTHNSLSQLAPICGVAGMKRKLYQHPPPCETGAGVLHVDQCLLQNATRPVTLPSQSQIIQSIAGACLMKQALEMNRRKDADGIKEEDSETQDGREHLFNGTTGDLLGVNSQKELDEKQCKPYNDSEVVVLISRLEDPANRDSRNLCRSLNGDYISPLEDPPSPSATSNDATEDIFALPQTLASPTGGNIIDDSSEDAGYNAFIFASLSEEEPTSLPGKLCTGDNTDTSVTSNGLHKLQDYATEPCRLSEEHVDGQPNVPESFHNGNTQKEKSTWKRKKPYCSRRGALLTPFKNFTPSGFNVSGDNQPLELSKKFPLPHIEIVRCKDTYSSEQLSSPKVTVFQEMNLDSTDTDGHLYGKTTSDSEYTTRSMCSNASPKKLCTKSRKGSLPPTPSSQGRGPRKGTKGRPKGRPKSQSPSKSLKKTLSVNRKRKKHKAGQSSFFSPQEPEIKLKYLTYKEEKKELRSEAFSPFVRLKKTEFSNCTIINYSEEEHSGSKKGHQPLHVSTSSGFMPGVVPATSCLQMGRVSTDGKQRGPLVCCLCGASANALDLGDLHGPYFPEGYKPSSKTLPSPREEDSSDSDTSFRPLGRMEEGTQGDCSRWNSEVSGAHTPTKRPCAHKTMAEDWYYPPVVPMETSEYWFHEDCCIWSAGVFLVRGRLYGLEEAVRLARETVCSMCHEAGATLGCFFKGCPSKYHYACAMQSECMLNEDNFSMKCTKHKNKSLKRSVNRQECR